MLKQLSILGAALAATAATVIPATPAEAQGWNRGGGYYDRYDRGGYRDYRGDDRYYRDNRGRNWDGGFRCRNDGTTGTIVGAIAGGLLGREVVGRRGDRTAGAIVGAGAGALAGRAIDRGGSRRC